MTAALKEKFEKFKTNLNLLRTLRLVWKVTNGHVLWMLILIVMESAVFFSSLYFFKILINAVAKKNDPHKTETVTTFLFFCCFLYDIVSDFESNHFFHYGKTIGKS